MKMPTLPVEEMVANLTYDESKIVRACFNRNRLRATKPFKKLTGDTLFDASVNYVWRMLCFDYVGFAPHNCMPITADFDVSIYYDRHEGGREASRKRIEYLDSVIKRAESALPITAQKGAMQWGRALGMI